MVRKYDRSSKRTTLINDDVRVYKGGSWRDSVLVRSCSKKVFSTRWLLIILDLDVSRVGPKSDGRKTPRN
jgi:hypothetical protein